MNDLLIDRNVRVESDQYGNAISSGHWSFNKWLYEIYNYASSQQKTNKTEVSKNEMEKNSQKKKSENVKRIIKSGPCTIVFWDDDTKTVVRCSENDIYDEYNAFCAALAIKIYGSNSKVKKVIKNASKKK